VPYRGERERGRAAEAPSEGLVADLVRQFADPYAFLRELVQNGVDAGARRIEVRVEVDGDDATFSVADDGSGMTRAIIEGPLLTVFSTSKEGDSSKIGKYGVGFVSVLALDPSEVLVETWRDGEAWLVRLGVDHRYELEALGPRGGSGTKVTLRKAIQPGAIAAHVARCRQALVRWCRHASVPIELVAPGVDGGALERERIDRPFALEAAITVEDRSDDGHVILGPSAGAPRAEGDLGADRAPTIVGFYNRGLTLHETTTPPTRALAGLWVKIMSPSLAHTLSRDDVRRDEAYERLVDRAEALVPALRDALAQALERAARAASGDAAPGAFPGLLEAAVAPPLALGERELALPLTDRVDGLAAMPLVEILARRDEDAHRILAAPGPTRLTAALARAGRPVVKLAHPGLATGLAGVPAIAPERVVALVEEAPASRADAALCAATRRAIEVAGVEVRRVVIATFDGAAPGRAAVAVGSATGPALVRTALATRWWRRLLAVDRLALVAGHALVERAREAAKRDPETAGHLLARALVVEERGALDAGDNERLLEDAARATREAP
jgi:molecular chaperone HtpG